jgi:WD40 repeat protein
MIQWTAINRRLHRGVRALGYSPDGAMLVSGGDDHSLCVWDPVSGERRADVRHHFPSIGDLAFSPDGRLLALAPGRRSVIVVCDDTCLRDGRLIGTIIEDTGYPEVSSIAFSPDGRNLVSAGAVPGSGWRAILWDVTALQRGGKTQIDALNIKDTDWLTAAYSSDGRTIALGSARGMIVFWPYPIPWEHSWRRGDPIDPVAYDRHVRRSRVAEVRAGSGDAVRRIAFSPDGTTLAASVGDVVVLWNYQHPDEKPPAVSNRRVLRGHDRAVRSLAFASEGRTIATASLDGTLRIWDTRAAFELSCLDAGAGPLQSLAIAPDGMTVAVGSEGGDIVIIDVDERP